MKKLFSLTSIGLVISLAVGTFYDLNINSFLFIKDNQFSYFFEHLAPVIFATVVMVGAGLIFWTFSFKQEKTIKVVFCGILYVLLTLLSCVMTLVYINWWGIPYSIIVSGVIIYLIRRLPAELQKRYRWAGIGILLTAFCSMAVVESIKPIWGRVRFRSMQENFALFTSWYQINGDKYLSAVPLKEEVKSFPSGHSQWAGTTLSLSFLALVNPKLKDKEPIFYGVAIFYALVLMVSRMMQGAHFLSDVTVGFGTAYIFFWIFHTLLNKLLKQKYPLEYL